MFKIKVFLWALRQSLISAPCEFILLVTFLLLQGIVPGLTLYVIQHLVDWLSTSKAELPIGLISILGIALLCEYIISPLILITRVNLNHKLLTHCNILLMQRTNEFNSLEPFENSDFYNNIQFLKEESKRRPLNFVYAIGGFFKDVFSLLSIFIVLASINTLIPFLIILVSIPHSLSMVRLEQKSWDQMLFASSYARKMAWFSSITLDEKAAQEIRLFGFGDYLIQRYKELGKMMLAQFRSERFKHCLGGLGLSGLTIVGYLAILIWLLKGSFTSDHRSGIVIMALQAFVMIQSNLSNLMQDFAMLNPVINFFEKLKKFLTGEFKVSIINKVGKHFSKLKDGIKFENVCFKYPDGRDALFNVNLDIRLHEKIAIVGENGAGKSTLIKLLMRMYDPTEGRILVDGEDLKNLDLESWRKYISAVFQDFGKYSLTAHENIGIGKYHEMDNLSAICEASAKGGFSEIVAKLPQQGQTLLGKEFGGTALSGGEWQKLAISRASMKDAGILILDEPTASLDANSEHEIFENFSSNAKDKTTLFITHRLGSVSMADRIIVIHQGRIIEQGRHFDLLQQKGHYENLFKRQSDRYLNVRV
jgi:ATP-binding cassette subfamily B protein